LSIIRNRYSFAPNEVAEAALPTGRAASATSVYKSFAGLAEVAQQLAQFASVGVHRFIGFHRVIVHNDFLDTILYGIKEKDVPVTHTNRKGVTYQLCRTADAKGRPRYVFARESVGEPVEAIPEGFAVRESVNGVVSLVRERPSQIRPEELRVVVSAVNRHPKGNNYRVDVKGKRIVVYERLGPDADELAEIFGEEGLWTSRLSDRWPTQLDARAQFQPIMRFTLTDRSKEADTSREFYAERWCFRGSVDDWIDVYHYGPIEDLAGELIPVLGTDEIFELY